MKKNILFVINNLNCGGAEKALISLLETIDYSHYNVDLLLFKHEGIFFSKIPQQVKLLEVPPNYKYFDMSIKTAVKDCVKKGKFNVLLSRVLAGFIFKFEINNTRCEQRVWRYLSKSVKTLNKKYDVAIGYLEKNPVYFCVDRVNSTKKIGFIHNDYDKLGMDPAIDTKYFSKLDNIVTVSSECANVLKVRFPMFGEKIKIMHNIVSPQIINEMSLEPVDDYNSEIKIVSIGRLSYQKGFDLAAQACSILVKNGYKLKWFVLGEGEERTKLEKLIEEYNLQSTFLLIGLKENPYPYIKEADIYVQPSRFEGKSIAVDEAKILHKPIVVTNFSTVGDQIINETNGLIVEMDANSISIGIERLINDYRLKNKLIHNLSKEELGTESEIEKFYTIIN